MSVSFAFDFKDIFLGFDLTDFIPSDPSSKASSKSDPTINVSNATYNYLVAGTLIVGGVILAGAALFWIDLFATERIDEVNCI